MEKRTPLYLYLEKLKAGDLTFLPKLCQQISDRLIYVPIVAGPEGRKAQNKALTVKVIKLQSDNKDLFPVFVTERAYRLWAEKFHERTEYISLLGGDFCGALVGDVAVVVDPGADHSIQLDSETVKKIATSTTTQIGQSVKQEMPQGMFTENLRGRSGPTALMPRPQRPQVQLDDEPTRPEVSKPRTTNLPPPSTTEGGRSITEQLRGVKREKFPGYRPVEDINEQKTAEASSTQETKRTVIFSPDSDANKVVREEEDANKKKKRSFLNFLKGSN